MTSPNANDIEANDNANNHSNNHANNTNNNSVVASGGRENASERIGRIGRIRVPPLLVIYEDDALPTGFAPVETILNNDEI